MGHKDFEVRVENLKVDDCVVYNYLKDDLKTVTIEHDQWGRVEGVTTTSQDLWEKEGAVYYRNHGWREVKPTRWVSVDYEIQREGKTLVAWVNDPETYPMHFHLGKGYRWKTVEIEKEVEG